ncbi:hypothetical protein GCM10020000_72040 [Streptomyces olivoverticillatus]
MHGTATHGLVAPGSTAPPAEPVIGTPSVTLLTEGTYPHSHGGVSVWCDQLVQGMPDVDFRVIAVTGTGREQLAWELPRHVRAVDTLPLWGPPPGGRAPRGRELRRFLTAYEHLLLSLLDPVQEHHFARAFYRLADHATSGTLAPGLRTEAAARLLTRVWNRPQLPTAAARPTLHDALTATDLLEHALRPLAAHPPAEGITHAVSGGLAAVPGLLARHRHGTPFLLTEHGVYLRERYLGFRAEAYRWPVKALMLGLFRMLAKESYRSASLVTPGNRYNRRWEEHGGTPPDRIRTVYNGVDPEAFPPAGPEPDVPTLSWAGRVDPIKGLETLIRAFATVRREIPDARLRLFGGTPRGGEGYRTACEDLAAELGVADAVTFEGRVEDIRDAYAARQCGDALQHQRRLPLHAHRGHVLRTRHRLHRRRRGARGRRRQRAGRTAPRPRQHGPRRTAPAARSATARPHGRGRPAARRRTVHPPSDDQRLPRHLPRPRRLSAARGARTPVAPAAGARARPGHGRGRCGMSGLLRLVPDEPEPVHDLAAPPARHRPRWAADPIDDLAEELAEVCATAVHPDEIAAVLEADGLTGEQITERYGRRDAFELAAELHARIPRSHPEPAPVPDPWKVKPGPFALRSLVFTLPGFGYALGRPLMTGAPDPLGLPPGTGALVASALVAWAWNQALAHRAYLRLAAGGRAAAGRCLRLGAPAGGRTGLLCRAGRPGHRRGGRVRRRPGAVPGVGHRPAGARPGTAAAARPGAHRHRGSGGPRRPAPRRPSASPCCWPPRAAHCSRRRTRQSAPNARNRARPHRCHPCTPPSPTDCSGWAAGC